MPYLYHIGSIAEYRRDVLASDTSPVIKGRVFRRRNPLNFGLHEPSNLIHDVIFTPTSPPRQIKAKALFFNRHFIFPSTSLFIARRQKRAARELNALRNRMRWMYSGHVSGREMRS